MIHAHVVAKFLTMQQWAGLALAMLEETEPSPPFVDLERTTANQDMGGGGEECGFIR